MDQPIPKIGKNDLERILKREFPDSNLEELKKIVNQYEIANDGRNWDRVKIAAIKNSNGDINKLKRQIKSAEHDHRELILSAEYPLCAGHMLTNLSSKEKKEIFTKDWKQYQEWFCK